MSKLAIVIIEDEKNILSFIEAALETHDYKVLTAVSGKEGLSLINACCPDMILLDLGLPDLDGIDIIKNVRSWSNIPIIVISARTQEQEKVAVTVEPARLSWYTFRSGGAGGQNVNIPLMRLTLHLYY